MYATSSPRGLPPNKRNAPVARFAGAYCVDGSGAQLPAPSGDLTFEKRDPCYGGEIHGPSIFGIKLCQQFAKSLKYEGMSVDVAENKRTKNVTLGLSVDIAENKRR